MQIPEKFWNQTEIFSGMMVESQRNIQEHNRLQNNGERNPLMPNPSSAAGRPARRTPRQEHVSGISAQVDK